MSHQRDYRRNAYNADFAHKGYEEAYHEARGQVPPFRPRKPKGKVNTVRTQYQSNRMDAHRKTTGAITEAMLSEELKKKLFPGVKTNQSAAERLEAVNTLKAITICVTTRSIGFGSAHIFTALFQFNNVPVRGTIYEMYRICLAAFEVKVQVVQRGVTAIQMDTEDYAEQRYNEDFVVAAKGIVVLPDQLSSVINTVGKVKQFDSLYVPKIGRNNTTVDQVFIPQPEQVTLSNLRRVVLALSNANVPVNIRLRFYQNNPIPGAIWRGLPDNPILQNPDEIMPNEYDVEDLRDEITEMQAKLSFLNRKAPKYFTNPVSFEADGGKGMLICNKQGTLRVIDRNPGEPLNDYYARLKLSGDVPEYYNLIRLTTGEQLDGNLTLLGEIPQVFDLQCPVYMNRDRRSCIENSSLGYKSSYNIKYT